MHVLGCTVVECTYEHGSIDVRVKLYRCSQGVHTLLEKHQEDYISLTSRVHVKATVSKTHSSLLSTNRFDRWIAPPNTHSYRQMQCTKQQDDTLYILAAAVTY
jgi:hypothetical protein